MTTVGTPGKPAALDLRLYRRRPDTLAHGAFEAVGGLRIPLDRIPELRAALLAEAASASALTFPSPG